MFSRCDWHSCNCINLVRENGVMVWVYIHVHVGQIYRGSLLQPQICMHLSTCAIPTCLIQIPLSFPHFRSGTTKYLCMLPFTELSKGSYSICRCSSFSVYNNIKSFLFVPLLIFKIQNCFTIFNALSPVEQVRQQLHS